MIKSVNKRDSFYFDIETRSIGRIPTKSNLLLERADNNLYFGMISDESVNDFFCDFFKVKDIALLQNEVFSFSVGDMVVNLVFNINAEGQIQLKFCRDSLILKTVVKYNEIYNTDFDMDKTLLILDFNNKTIRFKSINDFNL